ncbi:MAG: MBL fold metallo-hydrolase [Clostridiales bacterium]|nr:MBL fold metallo-hydrolase [Clostridiales bacterium]
MTKNIELLGHASIKIDKIYFDPFQLTENYNDAEYIFITHSHYDHFSEEDILKVKSENSVIIITNDLYEKTLLLGFASDKIIVVEPNKTYNINGLEFATIPAYNINKPFHPKENNWVGYVLKYNDKTYYIPGDTDITEENKKVKCDIAFIPVGGTYTTDYKEGAEFANIIKPQVAIPIHYGSIVGTKEDGEKFKELLNI